jgi:hypothetical protein
MPRIRLAHWHDGHAPGDVVDVDGDLLPALVRDGRVNEVLSGEPEFASSGALPVGLSAATNETGEAETVAAPPKRRKPSP